MPVKKTKKSTATKVRWYPGYRKVRINLDIYTSADLNALNDVEMWKDLFVLQEPGGETDEHRHFKVLAAQAIPSKLKPRQKESISVSAGGS